MAAVLATGFVFLHMPPAHAAACPTPSIDYGSVTSTVSVPATGTYRVWSRIMSGALATDNSYSLQIDNGSGSVNCYAVGNNDSMPTGAWSWVDYQNGNTSSKIDVSLNAGTYTFTMIGTEDGVQLDRVILATDLSCVPSDASNFGDNCAVQSSNAAPTVSINSPTANQTVSGQATVGYTATDDVGVTSTELYIDSSTSPDATDSVAPFGSFIWNSTAAADGSHTLRVRAYDANANSTITSVTVNVDNSPPIKPGDVNGDSNIDIYDLGAMASNWQSSGVSRAQGDLDGNGIVNIFDLGILAANWGL